MDGLYYPVECQVCGAGGNLEQTEDGKWKFVIQKDGLIKDRTTVEGRAKHLEEIGATQVDSMQIQKTDRLSRRKLQNIKIFSSRQFN